MEFSASFWAFFKLATLFAVFLTALRFKVELWIIILAGCILLSLMCQVTPPEIVEIFTTVPLDKSFQILAIMIFLILLLAGVQTETGQNRRLVMALENIIYHTRVRLMIFPALIGLLPMPGGAIFSCPMLSDASRKLDVSNRRKVLINYWFRHIWELAWPLYPGFILLSSMLGVSLGTMVMFNLPFVLISFCVGWFIILPNEKQAASSKTASQTTSPPLQNTEKEDPSTPPICATTRQAALKTVLYEGSPILVTFIGALLVSLGFYMGGLNISSQFSFIISTGVATLVSFCQGHTRINKPLVRIAFSYSVFKVLLLVFAIFSFKNAIATSGIIDAIGTGSTSRVSVYALFIILPFICGLLTGIMVGYVGTAFPIVLGLAAQMQMQDELLFMVMLGLIAGNAGQLLTPLHVCMVVSCSYFKADVVGVVKKLLKPTLLLCLFSALWAAALYMAGARL